MRVENTMKTFLKKSFLLTLVTGVAGCLVFSAQTVSAQEIPDPCPVPRALAQESPPDMASVQADIDILSLCVERARLLEQLNQLVKEMDNSLPAQMPSGLNAFPPMRADDTLFELPKTVTPTPAPIEDIVVPDVEEISSGPDWVIRKIGGNQSDGIQAELKNADGTIVRAKKGDTLFDGASVKDVSIMGVSIVKNGQEIILGWE